ncbi:MAG: methyltransferase domain-containing protein [Terriglobia bacterium]
MRKQPAPRPLLPLLLCLLASLLLAPLLTAQDAGSKRDKWQRPQEVMDALGIEPGSVVADVGSGSGYFTFHLAARVGPAGKVYAVDIDDGELAKIRRRMKKDGLAQIKIILGAKDDPGLPAATLDVALIVNAYHEMRRYDAMLQALFRALKPGGRLGIIEGVAAPGEERKVYYRRHRMPEELVREEATRNGFRFLRSEPGFLRPRGKKKFYFLIFEKPAL